MNEFVKFELNIKKKFDRGENIKMQPCISIIMPVYNAEEYLAQTIKSILNSTEKNIELICIDDGSTDDSLNILETYARLDTRVIAIQVKNGGPGKARNVGLNLAKGDYICFCDSDDLVPEFAYESLFFAAQENSSDIVIGAFEELFDSGEQKSYIPQGVDFREFFFTISIWNKIYRRKFLDDYQIRFPEFSQGEDRVFLGEIFSKTPYISTINTCVYYYLRHETSIKSSLTHTYSPAAFSERLLCWRKFLDNFKGTEFEFEANRNVIISLHYLFTQYNRLKLADKREAFEAWKFFLQYINWDNSQIPFKSVIGIDQNIFNQTATYDEYIYHKFLQDVSIKRKWELSSNIELSVIIPVFNAETYLMKCLDSIQEQTIEGLEIICVDDGSEDGSTVILEIYAKYDKRIKILKQSRRGAGQARNLGIKHAHGKYIHFLDADDYLEPNSYSRVLKKAKRYDVDLIKTRVKAFDNQTGNNVESDWYQLKSIAKKRFKKVSTLYDAPAEYSKVLVVPWNGLYRREFLLDNKIEFNNLVCVNDRSFYNEVIIKADRVIFSKTYLVNYRVNNNSSLVGKRGDYFDCEFKSFDIIQQQCKKLDNEIKKPLLKEELKDIFYWYLRLIKVPLYNIRLFNQMSNFVNNLDSNFIKTYCAEEFWYEEYLKFLPENRITIFLEVLNDADNIHSCIESILELKSKNITIILTSNKKTSVINEISIKLAKANIDVKDCFTYDDISNLVFFMSTNDVLLQQTIDWLIEDSRELQTDGIIYNQKIVSPTYKQAYSKLYENTDEVTPLCMLMGLQGHFLIKKERLIAYWDGSLKNFELQMLECVNLAYSDRIIAHKYIRGQYCMAYLERFSKYLSLCSAKKYDLWERSSDDLIVHSLYWPIYMAEYMDMENILRVIHEEICTIPTVRKRLLLIYEISSVKLLKHKAELFLKDISIDILFNFLLRESSTIRVEGILGKVRRVQGQYSSANRDYQAILNSTTYKVGKLIMYWPCALKDKYISYKAGSCKK